MMVGQSLFCLPGLTVSKPVEQLCGAMESSSVQLCNQEDVQMNVTTNNVELECAAMDVQKDLTNSNVEPECAAMDVEQNSNAVEQEEVAMEVCVQLCDVQQRDVQPDDAMQVEPELCEAEVKPSRKRKRNQKDVQPAVQGVVEQLEMCSRHVCICVGPGHVDPGEDVAGLCDEIVSILSLGGGVGDCVRDRGVGDTAGTVCT